MIMKKNGMQGSRLFDWMGDCKSQVKMSQKADLAELFDSAVLAVHDIQNYQFCQSIIGKMSNSHQCHMKLKKY